MDGWEPAEITTYEYDEQGRVVRAVTVREPEFSATDKAVLLESRRQSLAPRGAHGHLLSEAMDPANQFKWEVGNPRRDYAEQTLEKARAFYFAANPQAKDDSSLLWSVQMRQPQ